MHKFVRPTLAVILGFVAGSVINMGLITAGGKIVPPPAGADVTTMEGLKASIHLFEPRHFLFPFLAHALGALVGAFVATLIVSGISRVPGYVVGGLFFIGGLANIAMLPGPPWFSAVDLLLAYAPMAWLGIALAGRFTKGRAR